jgi:abhydrolase domain-containing protein 6
VKNKGQERPSRAGVRAVFSGWILESVFRLLRWRAGLQTRNVQVDDHRWVYLEGGKGESILFVPGFGMEKDGWGRFLMPFSKSYHLVVPDLPGFGESSRLPSANYGVSTQVERLHRFVETIGLRSFHLLGVSLGGYISGCYASQHPEKVKSLALMDTAGIESRIPSYAMQLYRKEGKIVLLYRTVEEFDALTGTLFYRPPPLPAPLKRYFANRGACSYAFHEKILRDLEHGGMYLLESRLPKISARTLVLWGENDLMVHVSSVEKLREGISNSRVIIFKNCGHVPFFEKRRETVRAYKAFLGTLRDKSLKFT